MMTDKIMVVFLESVRPLIVSYIQIYQVVLHETEHAEGKQQVESLPRILIG